MHRLSFVTSGVQTERISARARACQLMSIALPLYTQPAGLAENTQQQLAQFEKRARSMQSTDARAHGVDAARQALALAQSELFTDRPGEQPSTNHYALHTYTVVQGLNLHERDVLFTMSVVTPKISKQITQWMAAYKLATSSKRKPRIVPPRPVFTVPQLNYIMEQLQREYEVGHGGGGDGSRRRRWATAADVMRELPVRVYGNAYILESPQTVPASVTMQPYGNDLADKLTHYHVDLVKEGAPCEMLNHFGKYLRNGSGLFYVLACTTLPDDPSPKWRWINYGSSADMEAPSFERMPHLCHNPHTNGRLDVAYVRPAYSMHAHNDDAWQRHLADSALRARGGDGFARLASLVNSDENNDPAGAAYWNNLFSPQDVYDRLTFLGRYSPDAPAFHTRVQPVGGAGGWTARASGAAEYTLTGRQRNVMQTACDMKGFEPVLISAGPIGAPLPAAHTPIAMSSDGFRTLLEIVDEDSGGGSGGSKRVSPPLSAASTPPSSKRPKISSTSEDQESDEEPGSDQDEDAAGSDADSSAFEEEDILGSVKRQEYPAFITDTSMSQQEVTSDGKTSFTKSWRVVNMGLEAFPDSTEFVPVKGTDKLETWRRTSSYLQGLRLGGNVEIDIEVALRPDADSPIETTWQLRYKDDAGRIVDMATPVTWVIPNNPSLPAPAAAPVPPSPTTASPVLPVQTFGAAVAPALSQPLGPAAAAAAAVSVAKAGDSVTENLTAIIQALRSPAARTTPAPLEVLSATAQKFGQWSRDKQAQTQSSAAVDNAKINDADFLANFTIATIDGNGNCQFVSFGEGLKKLNVPEFKKASRDVNGTTTRAAACKWLRDNRTALTSYGIADLADFIVSSTDADKDTSWETYLSNMQNSGTWGDNLTLIGLANHYEVDIVVVSTTDVNPTVIKPFENKRAKALGPVILSYQPEFHYNLITPKEQSLQQKF